MFAGLDILLVASQGPSGVSPEGAARVLMCIAPLYLAVVVIRRERLWAALIASSAVLAIVFQAMFNLGYWFT